MQSPKQAAPRPRRPVHELMKAYYGESTDSNGMLLCLIVFIACHHHISGLRSLPRAGSNFPYEEFCAWLAYGNGRISVNFRAYASTHFTMESSPWTFCTGIDVPARCSYGTALIVQRQGARIAQGGQLVFAELQNVSGVQIASCHRQIPCSSSAGSYASLWMVTSSCGISPSRYRRLPSDPFQRWSTPTRIQASCLIRVERTSWAGKFMPAGMGILTCIQEPPA